MLEDCLGQDPAPRVLARYMPKVRAVLFRLLQGLQRKQAPYWRAVEREGSASGSERGSWSTSDEEWEYARYR